MGLDMYLDKKLYLSKYDGEEEKIDAIYNLLGVKDESDNFKHCEITLPAIYWRKSNQIHNWFVQNVQEGEDNCGRYDVGEENIKALLETVKKQLENKENIILKPQSGFFFGSTEIDEWYWTDLESTKTDLEREIAFIEEQAKQKRYWTFEYHSSW